ncbi:MAG TPA: enoyl-CoA hydratase-related protein [Acidobacteriota bacterium]|nr:enoyl-CoA hydratase-related protein [Acidobacteriota bacterium]
MNDVLCSIENGIARISINRPEQRNALNPAVLRGLRAALESICSNRTVGVITVTGEGDKVFCAGADLKAALAERPEGEAFDRSEYRDLLTDLLKCPKPTVALARGHVLAGGLGILLACDLSLACDDVFFSTPEIQVGMFPMMVLALLYRHVGRKRATEMLFLGERVPAAAALEYGIVNHIFPRAQFDVCASEYLQRIAAKSRQILKLGKEAIARIEDWSLAQELEYLEDALSGVMSTEDSREGIRAFLEKRKAARKIDE